MYKVTCRVIHVSEPKPFEGNELVPKTKCPIYKVGDRFTFTTWPTRLVMDECDNVCIFALNGITAATQSLCRDSGEKEDYTLSHFCCPDVHRPVAFRIEREYLPLDEIRLIRKPEED